MARPLRIEYENAVYHVTARGNERKRIYFCDADYRKFLQYTEEAKKKYAILLHSYVLMSNHYHLIIETPGANLSRTMHYINGAYTSYINRKRKRSGHLFQGRYKAIGRSRGQVLFLALRKNWISDQLTRGMKKKDEKSENLCHRVFQFLN